MSPDGRFFAVALVNDWNSSFGGGIDIYSSKGRKVYSWEDSQSLSGVVFSPDSNSVTSYSGSPVGGVTTYDLLNGKLVRKLNAKGNIVDVAYSPNGQALAVAVLAQNRSGAVVVYDAKNERVVYSRISDFPVYDVEFISNGHCLLSSGEREFE